MTNTTVLRRWLTAMFLMACGVLYAQEDEERATKLTEEQQQQAHGQMLTMIERGAGPPDLYMLEGMFTSQQHEKVKAAIEEKGDKLDPDLLAYLNKLQTWQDRRMKLLFYMFVAKKGSEKPDFAFTPPIEGAIEYKAPKNPERAFEVLLETYKEHMADKPRPPAKR